MSGYTPGGLWTPNFRLRVPMLFLKLQECGGVNNTWIWEGRESLNCEAFKRDKWNTYKRRETSLDRTLQGSFFLSICRSRSSLLVIGERALSKWIPSFSDIHLSPVSWPQQLSLVLALYKLVAQESPRSFLLARSPPFLEETNMDGRFESGGGLAYGWGYSLP